MTAPTESRNGFGPGIAVLIVVATIIFAGGPILLSAKHSPADGTQDAAAVAAVDPEPVREPGTIPADEAPLDLPGDEMFKGVYDLTQGTTPLGTEEFRITHNGRQISIDIRRRSTTEDAVKAALHLTENFDFRRAGWTQYSDPRVDASYRREGGSVRATIDNEDRRAAEEIPLTLLGHTLPPYPSTMIALILSTELEPGESRELETVYFGEPDWRMTPVQSNLSRGEDAAESGPGGRSTTQTYTFVRILPEGIEEVSRLRVTPGGLLMRQETTTRNGSWVATLRTLEN